MTPETPPTPLVSAFHKLATPSPDGCHLTDEEREAVCRYIARHGVSGEFLARSAVMLPREERPGLRPVVVKEAE